MDHAHVVWFKRDLRVADHAPLVHAARRGPVLPLYIVEPDLLRLPDYGPAHWTFIRESLRELRAALAALGQPLLVRVGPVIPILDALRAVVPFAALWAHEETGGAWTFARDLAVRRWAQAAAIPLTELPPHGVVRGYANRYPSRAAWPAHWEDRMRGPALAPPDALRPVPGLSPGPIPTHRQLGLPPDDRITGQTSPPRAFAPPPGATAPTARRGDDGPPNAQRGGETAAHDLLTTFLGGRGTGYRTAMSSPTTAPDTCSRLSAHLAWGTISLRTVVLTTRESVDGSRQSGVGHGESPVVGRQSSATRPALPGLTPDAPTVPTPDSPAPPYALRLTPYDSRPLLSRLHWHCHFIQKLEDDIRIEHESLIAPYDELRSADLAPLRDGPDRPERLAAWRAGRTGYPLIDACARALRGTGWLPFRMRALLVSFAAHDLWLPWQDFSDGLARLWVDYEPGIHLCQVQMQSGVTGGDALRLYNPTKQALEHDPTGTFIRRWVPELRRVPLPYLHQPWTLPAAEAAAADCALGRDYPRPLIDHEIAARAARAAIGDFRRRPDVRAATLAARARHSDPRRAARTPASPPSAAARQRAKGQLTLF